MTFTAQELLDCVDRELNLRRRVYPRQVASGKMTKRLADSEIAKMEAVRERIMEDVLRERLL